MVHVKHCLLLPLVLTLTLADPDLDLSLQNTVCRKFHQDPNAFQRLYHQHKLWDSHVRSLRECSVQCATDLECSSFSLVRDEALALSAVGGPRTLCRAYFQNASVVAQGSSFAVVNDAVLFEVAARWPVLTSGEATTEATTTAANNEATTTPNNQATATASHWNWVGEWCFDDDDCTGLGANIVCTSWKCVCIPGYYYSISTGDCVINCADNDLQANFTQYLGKKIADHDSPGVYQSVDDISLDECLNLCSNNHNGLVCRSVDYKSGWSSNPSKCEMRSLVALDVDSSDFTFSMSHHYQRQCA